MGTYWNWCVGFFLGLAIKLIVTKNRDKKTKVKKQEVVLMVCCSEAHLQIVQDTLWAYSALSIAKLDLGKHTHV